MQLNNLLFFLITSALVVVGLIGLQRWHARTEPETPEARLQRQLLLVLAYAFGLLLVTTSLIPTRTICAWVPLMCTW